MDKKAFPFSTTRCMQFKNKGCVTFVAFPFALTNKYLKAKEEL
jgi:hypothetical protein